MEIKKLRGGIRIDSFEIGDRKRNPIFIYVPKTGEPEISCNIIDKYTIEEVECMIEGLQKAIEIAEGYINDEK